MSLRLCIYYAFSVDGFYLCHCSMSTTYMWIFHKLMSQSRSLLCSKTVLITSRLARHKDAPVLTYLQPASCLCPSNLVLPSYSVSLQMVLLPSSFATHTESHLGTSLSFITHFQSITLSRQGYLTHLCNVYFFHLHHQHLNLCCHHLSLSRVLS